MSKEKLKQKIKEIALRAATKAVAFLIRALPALKDKLEAIGRKIRRRLTKPRFNFTRADRKSLANGKVTYVRTFDDELYAVKIKRGSNPTRPTIIYKFLKELK
jgi:hypothetical protein